MSEPSAEFRINGAPPHGTARTSRLPIRTRTLPAAAPLFEDVLRAVGYSAACVYGVVWRHCKYRDGACRISLRTIGRSIGLAASTVLRGLKKLEREGYLEDLTPRAGNVPHLYMLTGQPATLPEYPAAPARELA